MSSDQAVKTYLIDLKMVSDKPEGQRVFIWILDQLGTFDPSWTPKNPELAKAAVLRDFGQALLDDIAVASSEAHDAIVKSMRISRTAGFTNRLFKTEEGE
jgi:hypothetical protein